MASMWHMSGQRVILLDGRTGTLSGRTDGTGNPLASFGGGPPEPVTRDDVAGPVVHLFATRRQAWDSIGACAGIRDGDVLYVPAEDAAVVVHAMPGEQLRGMLLTGGTDRAYSLNRASGPLAGSLAAAYNGKYAPSVLAAGELLDWPGRPDGDPARAREASLARQGTSHTAGSPAATA